MKVYLSKSNLGCNRTYGAVKDLLYQRHIEYFEYSVGSMNMDPNCELLILIPPTRGINKDNIRFGKGQVSAIEHFNKICDAKIVVANIPGAFGNTLRYRRMSTNLNYIGDNWGWNYSNLDYLNEDGNLQDLLTSRIENSKTYYFMNKFGSDGGKSIDCSYESIVELPGLPKQLTYLSCECNNLTELPELPKGLTELDCRHNNLTELPELPKGLTA